MISTTSAKILEAELIQRKQQVLDLEMKADFTPDHQALNKLKLDASYQEGRYLCAKQLCKEKEAATEKRKWLKLKKQMKVKNKEYDDWLRFDWDKNDAAISAIESEIRDIERDLGPFKIRQAIEGTA